MKKITLLKLTVKGDEKGISAEVSSAVEFDEGFSNEVGNTVIKMVMDQLTKIKEGENASS